MPKVLTEEQVENFTRDGFVPRVRVLSAAAAAECRRELEAMEVGLGGSLRSIRTKFYLRYPWVYRLATSPAILDVVEDLIGPDILLYQNTAWLKDAGTSSYVSWHQDNTYFGHDPCDLLSVWIALTPSRPESGSVRFLAGSHKLGQLPVVQHNVAPGNMLSSGQTCDVDPGAFRTVAAALEPGEASIHHAFLVHSSPPNVSAERRVGITFMYHPPSVRQLGELRTSALLVRGEDRYGHFEPEQPPASADDPATIARHERGAALYRAKVQELGNRTVARFDKTGA